MSAFPGPGAVVYYNEAGEPLGWDYPSYDEPPEYADLGDGADVLAMDCEDALYDLHENMVDHGELPEDSDFDEWFHSEAGIKEQQAWLRDRKRGRA